MCLRLTILFGFLIPSVALAQAVHFAGTWKGYWTRAGDTLPITMVVQRDSTGRHTATFDSERLRVSRIPFAEVGTEGCCDVTLVLRGDRTSSVFKGRLRGDSLTGSFREGTSEGRFAYSRAIPSGAVFRRARHHLPQRFDHSRGNAPSPACAGPRPGRRVSTRLGRRGALGVALSREPARSSWHRQSHLRQARRRWLVGRLEARWTGRSCGGCRGGGRPTAGGAANRSRADRRSRSQSGRHARANGCGQVAPRLLRYRLRCRRASDGLGGSLQRSQLRASEGNHGR
jgi:hypothetical protein